MKLNVEEILRKLPSEEKIFRNQKRVYVIKAADCIVALSKLGMDSKQVREELQKLIDSYKLVRVRPSDKDPNSVDLNLSKTLNAGDMYIWAEEKREYINILIALLVIAFVFFLAMFQLWPQWLRTIVGYSRYLIMGIIGFFIVAGIVRLLVFMITYYSHPPGLWLLPNLFEECGVIESFKPLYCWANQDVSHKKKEE